MEYALMLIGVILNATSLKQWLILLVSQTELTQDEERIVRSTFSVKLNGYIIPEILQKDITALKKFSNKTKIIFSVEATDNTMIFDGNVEGDRIIFETASEKETQNRSTAIG